MNLFSISELAKLSGILPHTIRIWEKRYGALTPQRSDGNTRYYDDGQLRRLLNIVTLKERKYGLADLGAMSDQELFDLVLKEGGASGGAGDEYFISQLIAAGMAFDEGGFNHVFSHCLLRYGMREAYIRVLHPLLVRIGAMWTGDVLRPSAEHFMSKLIRQKLFTAIDSLPPAAKNAPEWLLFLPEDESHEIGLLVADYLLHQAGARTIYLGPNTPELAAFDVLGSVAVDYVLVFLVHKSVPEEVGDFLTRLAAEFKGKAILVAANADLPQPASLPRKVKLLRSVGELDPYLVGR